MDPIECKIKALFNGDIADDEEKEFLNIDYTLQQQNDELSSRGIESKVGPEFKPKIGLTVTYVVAVVVFNNQAEVLMMQEAKSSCAGSWYLPAGRVEPGESLEDAARCAVKRETGLECEPSTLLKVESSHGNWFRFVFAAHITGGQLKTVAKADHESLQACYVSDVTKLSLRSHDCLKLIELGLEHQKKQSEWHPSQLTIHRSVPNIFLRLVIGIRNQDNKAYFVLTSDSLVPHLPLCEVNPMRSVHSSLKRFMQYIFGADPVVQHKPCGLLVVEHKAAGLDEDLCDGLCLTLLVMCKEPLENVVTRTGFTWRHLDSSLEHSLLSKLASKHRTITHTVL